MKDVSSDASKYSVSGFFCHFLCVKVDDMPCFLLQCIKFSPINISLLLKISLSATFTFVKTLINAHCPFSKKTDSNIIKRLHILYFSVEILMRLL